MHEFIKRVLDIYDKSTKVERDNHDHDKYFNTHESYQAIIILDGKLISAEMNEKYNIDLEEVDFAGLDIDLKSKNYDKKCRVDIVTLKGLDEYLNMRVKKQEVIGKALMKLENFNDENCREWKEI